MSLLIIAIPGKRKLTFYRLERLEPDAQIATRAWRLYKLDKNLKVIATYDVSKLVGGRLTCECQDESRRNPGNCKHLKSMREQGLL